MLGSNSIVEKLTKLSLESTGSVNSINDLSKNEAVTESGENCNVAVGIEKNVVLEKREGAWDKPQNGVLVDAPQIMAINEWPALTDSARVFSNSRSSSQTSLDSLKAQDGLILAMDESVTNPSSSSGQNSHISLNGPSISTTSTNDNPTAAAAAVAVPSSVNNTNTQLRTSAESSNAEVLHKNNNNSRFKSRGSASSQPRFGNNNHSYNYRRGNGRPHLPDAPHYYYGHAATNPQWNPHWNYSRDLNFQQQRSFMGNYQRPFPISMPLKHPPVMPPYIPPPPPPPPIATYGNSMTFPDAYSQHYAPYPPLYPDTLEPTPVIPPGPPLQQFYYEYPLDELKERLMNQIHYYFSSDNLCKDKYLRDLMDESGWVSVSKIANFNRVQRMTNDINFILYSLSRSPEIEVLGDKIRGRNNWQKWVKVTQISPRSDSPESSVTSVNGPQN